MSDGILGAQDSTRRGTGCMHEVYLGKLHKHTLRALLSTLQIRGYSKQTQKRPGLVSMGLLPYRTLNAASYDVNASGMLEKGL